MLVEARAARVDVPSVFYHEIKPEWNSQSALLLKSTTRQTTTNTDRWSSMHRPMFSPLSVPDRSIGLKPVPPIGTPTAAAPEPCPECEARNGPMSGDANYPTARSAVRGRSREKPSRWAGSLSSALVVASSSIHASVSTQAAVWVSKNHARVAS